MSPSDDGSEEWDEEGDYEVAFGGFSREKLKKSLKKQN